jgi:hypothetical protein
MGAKDMDLSRSLEFLNRSLFKETLNKWLPGRLLGDHGTTVAVWGDDDNDEAAELGRDRLSAESPQADPEGGVPVGDGAGRAGRR